MLANFRHLATFVLLSSFGFGIAFTTNLESTVQDSLLYPFILNGLLAIGLYTAVRGIDLNEAKLLWRRVLGVVTVGVIAKVIIISSPIGNDLLLFTPILKMEF